VLSLRRAREEDAPGVCVCVQGGLRCGAVRFGLDEGVARSRLHQLPRPMTVMCSGVAVLSRGAMTDWGFLFLFDGVESLRRMKVRGCCVREEMFVQVDE